MWYYLHICNVLWTTNFKYLILLSSFIKIFEVFIEIFHIYKLYLDNSGDS